MLGLDRIETASLLPSKGTFQHLIGLPNFPDPQTLRRFLLQAAPPDSGSTCIASTTDFCIIFFISPRLAPGWFSISTAPS